MTPLNLFTIIPNNEHLLKFSEAKSARAYYADKYVDLLTGEIFPHNIHEWLRLLDFPLHHHQHEGRIIHLFYELGFLFEKLSELIGSDDLLAIDIEYTKVSRWTEQSSEQKIELTLLEKPQYDDYKKKFEKGYKELTEGNCYQFNLTGKYVYRFNKEYRPEVFISALWRQGENRGAFGSATYSEHLNLMLLSNSPECLFRYEDEILCSMPIKGTLKRMSHKKNDIAHLWKKLTSDKKSQAELFMITDLLRNDLGRIDLPNAQVTKRKAPLLVPGLIHQYSEIQVPLRRHVSLKETLEKIFPGGSITGAPKKRVMRILKKLENRSRGFYCGSTLLFSKEKISASINIRSSVIDFKKKTIIYQAGGGITLLSQPQAEFEEMTYKHDSFFNTLTL